MSVHNVLPCFLSRGQHEPSLACGASNVLNTRIWTKLCLITKMQRHDSRHVKKLSLTENSGRTNIRKNPYPAYASGKH